MKKLIKVKQCGDVYAPVTGKLLYLVLCELANRNIEVIISREKSATRRTHPKVQSAAICAVCVTAGYIDRFPQYHNDDGRTANKYILK